jgi:hypothetical protein
VAAWFPDMFNNSYSVKIHKIVNYLATTEGKEKISTDIETLEFYKTFNVCLTKFERNQILPNKIND